MIYQFIFLFHVLLGSIQSHASSFSLDQQKTSDEIYSSSGSLKWDLPETPVHFSYALYDLEFRRAPEDNAAQIQKMELGTYLNVLGGDKNLSLGLGLLVADSANNVDHEAVGQIKYSGSHEKLTYYLGTERLALAEQLRATSLSGVHIFEHNVNAGMNYLFLPRWKWQVSAKGASLSDGNELLSYDTSFMYQLVASGWPWIWLGYGYGGLNHQEVQPGYWSPKQFYSHGPRFDSSFPLFAQLSGIVAVNLNYYNESGTRGDGYFIVSGLQWGRHDDTHVRFTYNKIRSGQGQSPWVYEGFRLSCSIFQF